MSSPHESLGYLFVVPWDLHERGGVDQVVINLFRQFIQSGRWKPIVCINTWESPKPDYLEVDGRPTVRIRLITPWMKDSPWIGGISFLARLPFTLIMLHRMLRKEKIATVNIHYSTLSSLLFSLLRRLGAYNGKIVLSFHGTDAARASEAKGIELWLWRNLLSSVDSIVTCSSALKQRILDLVPSCEEKIKVVYNGLDAKYFRESRDVGYRLDGALAGHRCVLAIGTFRHIKGQDVLVEAFKEIAGELPDVILVIVGGAGPMQSVLKEQVSRYDLSSRVFFYQDMSHDRIPIFLEQAKIFCLPSRSEAFPISLLEAGAFSLPVVASCVGGVPELITDGEHGRLVPANDVGALAKALLDLLEHENVASTLGINLRHRVESQFSWKNAFDEYEKISIL